MELKRNGQQKDYLVLTAEERAKGFVEPVRRSYVHEKCGSVTTMSLVLAETYARCPDFYAGTFCSACSNHFPVGADGEFVWDTGSNQKVGTRSDGEGQHASQRTIAEVVARATPPKPEPVKRLSWDAYFIDIAHVVSLRGTCNRKRVGCVLAKEHRILATGYNGSVPGAPHCDDVGHDLVESIIEGKSSINCVRTVHAEINAIAQAAFMGIKVRDAIAYVNTYPCWPCAKVLLSSGIAHIVYADEYKLDARVAEACHATNVGLTRFVG